MLVKLIVKQENIAFISKMVWWWLIITFTWNHHPLIFTHIYTMEVIMLQQEKYFIKLQYNSKSHID